MTQHPHTVSLERPRVLLAEDDPDYRRLIADALAVDGYEVITAESGIEAMNQLDISYTDPLNAGFPSVVITDIHMPGVDGFGLLSYASHIPTVVITAFGSHEAHQEAYRRGARRVLDKPFKLSTLRAEVRHLASEKVSHLPRPRLLIADDDHDFVSYLSDLMLMRDAGTVVAAYDGSEALEALAENGPFDLICTDHRMPGPNGAQLVTMVRYAGYTGPILIITAFPSEDVERAADANKLVRLLPKSANPDQFVHAAAELMQEGRTHSVH